MVTHDSVARGGQTYRTGREPSLGPPTADCQLRECPAPAHDMCLVHDLLRVGGQQAREATPGACRSHHLQGDEYADPSDSEEHEPCALLGVSERPDGSDRAGDPDEAASPLLDLVGSAHVTAPRCLAQGSAATPARQPSSTSAQAVPSRCPSLATAGTRALPPLVVVPVLVVAVSANRVGLPLGGLHDPTVTVEVAAQLLGHVNPFPQSFKLARGGAGPSSLC